MRTGPLNRDFNGAEQDGFGLLYSNVRDGERVDARRGYLQPAAGRPNLRVVTGARVRQVLLDGDAVRVVAVTVDGEDVEVQSGSVLVCAGGFRSPQLLMLSGIGPADHLREHGLDVRVDLPGVGSNLHDHPTSWVSWPVTRGQGWSVPPEPAHLQRYAERRGGPLASIGQAGAFLRCGDGVTAPDIQLTPMLMDLAGRHRPGFSVGTTLLTPRSRGSVRLASADVADAPVIDPRLLADGTDLEVLAAGVREVLRLGRTPALGAVLGPSELPVDCDDAALRGYLRATTITLNHPVGTCRAGTDGDSVVDPQLRVHGVRGLRVVDSSVMPTATRANTHAASVMIGERGSELLRAAS